MARHMAPVKGCFCAKCEDRRAYARQWHKDQRALRTPYALRQKAIQGRWLAKQSDGWRTREYARHREKYASNPERLLVHLLYMSLMYHARMKPCWPWYRPGVSARDREKLRRLVA